jgi:RNA polymerase sigma-70 factor (ECF subfamily)
MKHLRNWTTFITESFLDAIQPEDFNKSLDFMDQDLVEGCAKGDKKMQDMLFYKYSKFVRSICFLYMKNEEDADDLAMKSYVKIFKNIHTLKEPNALKSWIKKLVAFTCIQELRKMKVRQPEKKLLTMETPGLHITDDSINIEDAVENKDLMKVIDILPGKAKRVFQLYAIDGRSHEEIANELGINIGTSKSQYSRAKKALIAELKRLEEETTK